jgi:hypothetical protein
MKIVTQFKQNKMSKKDFKRSFGVPKNIFDLMLKILTEAFQIKKKRGGSPNKLTVEEQLFMTLEYWREYRTYFNIAKSRGIKENTCFRNIKWVEDTLIKSGMFNLPNKRAIAEDKKHQTVIVDATEIPIERPINSQKKWYSGKKKMHTIKAQLIIDANSGEILSVATSEGKQHDFKLWKRSKKIIESETKILADSGYTGMKKIHKKSHISVKKNVEKI